MPDGVSLPARHARAASAPPTATSQARVGCVCGGGHRGGEGSRGCGRSGGRQSPGGGWESPRRGSPWWAASPLMRDVRSRGFEGTTGRRGLRRAPRRPLTPARMRTLSPSLTKAALRVARARHYQAHLMRQSHRRPDPSAQALGGSGAGGRGGGGATGQGRGPRQRRWLPSLIRTCLQPSICPPCTGHLLLLWPSTSRPCW